MRAISRSGSGIIAKESPLKVAKLCHVEERNLLFLACEECPLLADLDGSRILKKRKGATVGTITTINKKSLKIKRWGPNTRTR